MNSSLYIGATGMKSLAEGMNVITNNLANVSTIGFKQQDVQFADLMYASQGMTGEGWETQTDSKVALGQLGMGVMVNDVRTLFSQGSMQLGSAETELALNGSGFFQVQTVGGEIMYSRAGNFHIDQDGNYSLPEGHTLMGYPVDTEGNKGEIQPINIDPFDVMAAKATTEVSLGFNFGKVEDKSPLGETDPYFSLAKSYNNETVPPLSDDQYSYTQPIRIYDAAGKPQDLTLYVDGAPSNDPDAVMEFLIADNNVNADGKSQALMSGTMTFDSAGNLIGVNYYTPNGGDTTDLNNWLLGSTNGAGQGVLNYNGQSIGVDFGLTGTMEGAAATAAAVGADRLLLGVTGNAQLARNATSAHEGSNSMHLNEQDGYAEGFLTNISIDTNGNVVGSYSNNQDTTLYEIPVARFINEDGLYREGGNLFSVTDESGPAELGVAGTENFGSIISGHIEGSNVDMSAEMVDMIITQRGFQSNSKVVTTADEMLKKAMELKRQ